MNTLLRAKSGFTIIEIIVVIAVIGILVGIVYVSYNGIQRNAGVSTLKNDLTNASKEMTISFAYNNAFPGVLPADVKASPDVELTLVKSTGGYSGLTDVQNGVLFYNVCQSLINEGLGKGKDKNGGTATYITSCNVYNKPQIEIHAWVSGAFTVPISTNTIRDYFNTKVSYDSYFPDKQTVFNTFATTLSSRFTSLGGTFPVTSFWDDWATSTNGGVMAQPLPAPQPPSDPTKFCIKATHTKYNITMYITNDSAPRNEECQP